MKICEGRVETTKKIKEGVRGRRRKRSARKGEENRWNKVICAKNRKLENLERNKRTKNKR
jgi:hypothetical protein